ncbi:MAG TPA: CRISPR system precrRNA processing endoribonuclease RAMP protein Cas6 [Methylococcus sp.]|nr:CRISPR system precrRNA processing endoribonuclease RAMP protein Cas6 [Methylococcus sp.]
MEKGLAMSAPPTEYPLPRLPLGEYRLVFRYDPPLRLPAHAGFAWRGAFGAALKSTVCVVAGAECTACMLRHSCAYSLIFETPAPPEAPKMRRYQRIPHPFALRVQPAGASTEGNHALGVILFGYANRQLPYVLHALRRAGERGITSMRRPFFLQRVEQRDVQGAWQVIYDPDAGQLRAHPPITPPLPPMPERLTVRWQTPFRGKAEDDLVTPERFRFHHFFGPLLRRISMLTAFHADNPLETDFAGLMRRAREVEVTESSLHWRELTRYSSRQKTLMRMGGLLGAFDVSMAGLEALWPYLWLGQWTLAGKGTSMGLGAYRIEVPSLPV